MINAQTIENRIIHNLLRDSEAGESSATPGADRLIRIVAVTAGLFLLGSYLQELLWVSLAAVTVTALGIKK